MSSEKKKRFKSSIDNKSIKSFEYSSFENITIIFKSETNSVSSADFKDEGTTKAVALKTNVSNDDENSLYEFIKEESLDKVLNAYGNTYLCE
ncbi:34837_t:CDS:2 [Racocetra persica]|uniref:34837_t:CDS:1 n=1 Tax=Racocetra persica TaxID=160502 RepID=A0ACA9KS04_9GLOM|nr:34837_t:CDS:2 [Racocetra persica]